MVCQRPQLSFLQFILWVNGTAVTVVAALIKCVLMPLLFDPVCNLHVTFTAIVPGVYTGEAKMCIRLIAETDQTMLRQREAHLKSMMIMKCKANYLTTYCQTFFDMCQCAECRFITNGNWAKLECTHRVCKHVEGPIACQYRHLANDNKARL